LLFLLVLDASVIQSYAPLPDFPNIGYLGMGYNLVLGDPSGSSETLQDPGWVILPAIQLTYLLNKTTSDGRYQVPDQVVVIPALSCAFESSAETSTQLSDYQNTLKVDVSVSGGYNGGLVSAAFSASAGFQEASQEITNQNLVIIYTKSVCQTYEAKLLAFSPIPNVTENFRALVAQLPLDDDDPIVYWEFIATFGTHYSQGINMGAKAVIQYLLSSISYQNLQSQDVDVSVGASLSYLGAFGMVINNDTTGYKDYVAFKNSISSQTTMGIGALPPVQSNVTSWYAWEQSINNEPVPMQYDLASIANLLNEDLFPNDPNILQKQANLLAALETYCGAVPHCFSPPPPPPTPTNWTMDQRTQDDVTWN